MADGPLPAAADGDAGLELADRADWLEAVEQVLRGRPFDEALVSTTRDGLRIVPLYTAADLAADADSDPAAFAVPADPGRIRHGWDVRQRHVVGDPAADPTAVNAAILDDLRNGVTSIELAAASGAAGTGDALAGGVIAAALDGVDLVAAPVALAPHNDLPTARALADLITAGAPAAPAGAWLGLDPIGHRASIGALGGRSASPGVSDTSSQRSSSGGLTGAAVLAAELAGRLGPVRVFTADGVRYADAGATPAQELGWMLATGVAYLRALEQAGADMPTAAAAVGLRASAGADQFATTAALRALRGCWARALEACGVGPSEQSIRIQAVTAEAMFSRRDPWTNMLRSTSAVLGAVLGGADAVTVLPHDALRSDGDDEPRAAPGGEARSGPGDALSRRLARNVQLLLAEESQIARLADPTAGSWFVESLTARLAEAAWAVFGGIEAAGGMETAVGSGSIAAAALQAAEERSQAMATRQQAITGVSEHPELPAPTSTEDSPDISLAKSPDYAEAEAGEPPAASRDQALPLRRPAAPFEELQDAAERAPQRPRVFAAALGDLAAHTARSSWAASLLAVGGIELVGADRDGALSPLEAAASFAGSGCAATVICSTDAFYSARAAATATALKEAGAQFVALAGAPDSSGELAAAGVDEYWHEGIDVLAALRHLHHLLGVSEPELAAGDYATPRGPAPPTGEKPGGRAAVECSDGPDDDSGRARQGGSP